MAPVTDAGLPAATLLSALDLGRDRALGRVWSPTQALADLLDPAAFDLDWQPVPFEGGRRLEWAREAPGLYAADGPALTTAAAHHWIGEPGDDDLVIDARTDAAWLLLPSGDHVVALHLHGPEVRVATVPIADVSLPRPPVEAWGLAKQPDWLQQRTFRDLTGGLLRRAAALGRLLRLRTHTAADLLSDPTAGLRRWWSAVPLWLTARVQAEAIAASAPLVVPPHGVPQLLLRDDLASVRWLLRTHPGGCDALDARLAEIDRREPVPGSEAADPQLAAAAWRTPDAWWAAS